MSYSGPLSSRASKQPVKQPHRSDTTKAVRLTTASGNHNTEPSSVCSVVVTGGTFSLINGAGGPTLVTVVAPATSSVHVDLNDLYLNAGITWTLTAGNATVIYK